MTIRNLLLAASAVSLATAPIAATATDIVRSAEPVTGESNVMSMDARFLIGAILAAGLVIWIIADDDDDDDPVSP